jgi:hypothetical protein
MKGVPPGPPGTSRSPSSPAARWPPPERSAWAACWWPPLGAGVHQRVAEREGLDLQQDTPGPARSATPIAGTPEFRQSDTSAQRRDTDLQTVPWVRRRFTRRPIRPWPASPSPRAGRGSPSLLLRAGGELLAVYVPVIDGGKIAALYMIAAPDKLALIRRQAHPVRPTLNVDTSDRTRSKDRSVQSRTTGGFAGTQSLLSGRLKPECPRLAQGWLARLGRTTPGILCGGSTSNDGSSQP